MTDTSQADNAQADDKVSKAIRDLAALSIVFSTTIADLNEVAAKQLSSLLEIAINAARAAQSLASQNGKATDVSVDESFAPLLAQLKEASNSYTGLNQQAGDALDNAALDNAALDNGSAADATVPPADQLATLVNVAYANTIANTNLAQQNAVANQQAVNQIGITVLGKSVTVVLSAATPASSDQALRQGV